MSLAQPSALLVSVKEAAEILSVSRPLVRQWIANGRLQAVTVPGHELLRIRFEELQRFVRDECVPVAGPIRAPRTRKEVA